MSSPWLDTLRRTGAFTTGQKDALTVAFGEFEREAIALADITNIQETTQNDGDVVRFNGTSYEVGPLSYNDLTDIPTGALLTDGSNAMASSLKLAGSQFRSDDNGLTVDTSDTTPHMLIWGRNSTVSRAADIIEIQGGNDEGNNYSGGDIRLEAGDSSSNQGGDVVLLAGASTHTSGTSASDGGNVSIEGGNSFSNDAGNIRLTSGTNQDSGGNGGDVDITANFGSGSGNNSGNIFLKTLQGISSAADGYIEISSYGYIECKNFHGTDKLDFRLTDLPTADPLQAGQLWNDSGTLKISAG